MEKIKQLNEEELKEISGGGSGSVIIEFLPNFTGECCNQQVVYICLEGQYKRYQCACCRNYYFYDDSTNCWFIMK